MSGRFYYDSNPQSDNSPKPNPTTPVPQSISNSGSKSDNSVSRANSHQPINNVKTIKFESKENTSQNNLTKPNSD